MQKRISNQPHNFQISISRLALSNSIFKFKIPNFKFQVSTSTFQIQDSNIVPMQPYVEHIHVYSHTYNLLIVNVYIYIYIYIFIPVSNCVFQNTHPPIYTTAYTHIYPNPSKYIHISKHTQMDSRTSSGISKYIQKYLDANTREGKDPKHDWMCQNRMEFIPTPGIYSKPF